MFIVMLAEFLLEYQKCLCMLVKVLKGFSQYICVYLAGLWDFLEFGNLFMEELLWWNFCLLTCQHMVSRICI
jgi:steroid 5-alpha reductase family enzyme